MSTKAYAIILATVVVLGFALIGIVLFHDPVLVKQRPKVITLNIDSMKEASDIVIDSTKGPGVDQIFPANHHNTEADSIPWADAYVCRSFSKADSLSGDTVILILDTKTDDKLYKIEYPQDYWTGLKTAPKFKKCRIVVPPGLSANFKRYRYKYAEVGLITDD